MGGWSQGRYQRHIESFHEQHMKEVVKILDRIVREEAIAHVVIACDEVAKPLFMAQMLKHLADRIVDVVKLDMNTPERDVLSQTMDALQRRDADGDAPRCRPCSTTGTPADSGWSDRMPR